MIFVLFCFLIENGILSVYIRIVLLKKSNIYPFDASGPGAKINTH